MKVVMPYIGGVLSVNAYKVRGRYGLATNATKRVVKLWMHELTQKVEGFEHQGSLTISLYGKFVDERVPDLANLHKVIGDAIKEGLSFIDDKDFKFVDLGYGTGYVNPVLEMTLTTE